MSWRIGDPTPNELAILAGGGELAIEAVSPSRLVLGSAQRHAHELVSGPHSVHTSQVTLARGIVTIDEVGREFRATHRLS